MQRILRSYLSYMQLAGIVMAASAVFFLFYSLLALEDSPAHAVVVALSILVVLTLLIVSIVLDPPAAYNWLTFIPDIASHIIKNRRDIAGRIIKNRRHRRSFRTGSPSDRPRAAKQSESPPTTPTVKDAEEVRGKTTANF